LVPELPPAPQPEPPTEYVTVLEAGNPAVLAVAKSLLESAQIEYLALGEALQDIIGWGRLGPGNFITGPVRVRVRREDEPEAREILRDLPEHPSETALPGAVEEVKARLEESQSAQPAPTDISGRPWRRQLTLLAQAVVVVVVIVTLVEWHRAGRA